MSCPEEFGTLGESLVRYVKLLARLTVLDHECTVHKDWKACGEREETTRDLFDADRELSASFTDLSRCLERKWIAARKGE